MQVQLIESVKNAIDYITSSENYLKPEIDVTRGSEEGDGYSSKNYSISIKSGDGRSVNLFVKYLPELRNKDWVEAAELGWQTEFCFYNDVYPILDKFQEDRNVTEPFTNVPKHFKTNIIKSGAPPIVLENISCLGYKLRDRKQPVDDHHLRIPLQAFARFHAISYAMRDQQPEQFGDLSAGMRDFFNENLSKFGMDKQLDKCVSQFLESLDPVTDERILNHCKDLSKILNNHAANIPQNLDEYAVIGQGDCWSSNMMFLYDTDTGNPIDVKLIDWQCQRLGSPLLDFSYFFYTLATKEFLDDGERYLNLYYDTLAQRIKELGSDPVKMFSRTNFFDHWKKFALYGLTMAFYIVKAQLFEKEEIPDYLNSTNSTVESFGVVLKHQDKYINRMKDLVIYFIDHDFLHIS